MMKRNKTKVLIIDGFGNQETLDMDYIPRVGDLVPIFSKYNSRVNEVSWFPEKIISDLKGSGIHVVITVGGEL